MYSLLHLSVPLPHFHALPSVYFKNVLLGHVNEGSAVKLF